MYPQDLLLLTKVTALLFIWSDGVAGNPCYLVNPSERVSFQTGGGCLGDKTKESKKTECIFPLLLQTKGWRG